MPSCNPVRPNGPKGPIGGAGNQIRLSYLIANGRSRQAGAWAEHLLPEQAVEYASNSALGRREQRPRDGNTDGAIKGFPTNSPPTRSDPTAGAAQVPSPPLTRGVSVIEAPGRACARVPAGEG